METSGNFNPTSNPSASDVQETIKSTARPAVERVASGAHQAVDTLAGAANEAVDTLSVKGGQLKEMQSRWMSNGAAYVQEHPVASLGIAVAAGFLISRLLTTNSHSTHGSR